MRKTIHMTAALFLILANVAAGAAGRPPAKPALVIVGTVVKVGPSPGRDSGGVDVYQLVRYQVKQVCRGQYQGEEIVVDHPILRADELGDLKVGDTVCLALSPKKRISLRYDDDVVRKSADEVGIYYVGKALKQTASPSCKCG